jgi:hypothetical protein
MRGIVIDPWLKQISAVETDASLKEIYRLCGCDTIDAVYIDRTHCIYVDDNGLTYNDPIPVFVWQNYPQPLAGRGLLLGFDIETGANVDCTIPVGVVHAMVTFPALAATHISTHEYTRDDGTFVIENRPHFKRTGKD